MEGQGNVYFRFREHIALELVRCEEEKNVTDVGVAKRRALLSNWYLSNLDTSAYTMICD